jgi:hypothetical protein
MRMLDFEAYRPSLRAQLGSRQAMVVQGAGLLRYTKVFRLAYPRDFDRLHATAASLREHWAQFAG